MVIELSNINNAKLTKLAGKYDVNKDGKLDESESASLFSYIEEKKSEAKGGVTNKEAIFGLFVPGIVSTVATAIGMIVLGKELIDLRECSFYRHRPEIKVPLAKFVDFIRKDTLVDIFELDPARVGLITIVPSILTGLAGIGVGAVATSIHRDIQYKKHEHYKHDLLTAEYKGQLAEKA